MSCRKALAPGQYWSFCGETDMGQTLPALCTDCGGSFKLADPQTRELTDDDLRWLWRNSGGSFHGPITETGTMPESLLLPFLRRLMKQ